MEQPLVPVGRAPIITVSLPTDSGYQDFKLWFDFTAIIKIKKKTGHSLLSGDTWGQTENDPELVAAILWGGLGKYHPELDYETVCGMLLPGELGEVLPKVRESWLAVRPKADDPTTEIPITQAESQSKSQATAN